MVSVCQSVIVIASSFLSVEGPCRPIKIRDRSLYSALALQLLDKCFTVTFFFFLVAGVPDRDVSVPFLLIRG